MGFLIIFVCGKCFVYCCIRVLVLLCELLLIVISFRDEGFLNCWVRVLSVVLMYFLVFLVGRMMVMRGVCIGFLGIGGVWGWC